MGDTITESDRSSTRLLPVYEHSITPLHPIVKIFTAKKENAEREMQRGVPKRSLANATSSAPKMLGHNNTVASNLLQTDQAFHSIVYHKNKICQPQNPISHLDKSRKIC